MGKETKKVEFKDFLDTKGLSEDESKVFDIFAKGLDNFMEALFKQFMEDEIDSKSMKESIENASKSIEDLKKEVKGFADSESINERLKQFEETIVRIKAASEKDKNGDWRIKSLGEQIADACKDCVIESGGIKKIDVESLKKKGGIAFDVVLKAAASPVTTAGGSPVAGGITIDNTISVNPR